MDPVYKPHRDPNRRRAATPFQSDPKTLQVVGREDACSDGHQISTPLQQERRPFRTPSDVQSSRPRFCS